MNADILLFFQRQPIALSLYEEVEAKVTGAIPGVKIKVQKTQITFYDKRVFACVSLPRRAKDRPGILFTFGLGHRLEHPRVTLAVEPYPNRWTHHVMISAVSEIDAQLMEWAMEAHAFSMAK